MAEIKIKKKDLEFYVQIILIVVLVGLLIYSFGKSSGGTTGTDIAIEAGDIVLAKGSLVGVVQAINLSKSTFGKIKQNLFWAFAYNIIAIPVAIAGLLHPVIAEIAMALSSITVVTNANLLRRKKI